MDNSKYGFGGKVVRPVPVYSAEPCLVMRFGYSGASYYDESKEDAWNRSVEMMRKVCDYAKANDILVAIEALQPDESVLVNSVEQLKAYLDAVNHPQLKVCIDFGAMARVNNTIQDYFDAFGKDVIHTHFVDGKPTGHLAWSDGTRDLKQDLLDLEAKIGRASCRERV